MRWSCKSEQDRTDEDRENFPHPNCCGKHLLESQPDFQQQKTAIHEAVVKRGHIFELYPKFHCECNYIERFWGAAKRAARIQCDYTFKGLKQRVPEILDSIPLVMIKKFCRKAWRYIDAYHLGYKGLEADSQVKLYKSHRKVGTEQKIN